MRQTISTHMSRARAMAGQLIKSGVLQRPMVFASTLVVSLSKREKMSNVPAWSMTSRKNSGTRSHRLHGVVSDTKVSLL